MILNFSYWCLLLSLIPLLYYPARWCYFELIIYRFSKTKSTDGDIACVKFLDKLQSETVFEWEIRKFVIPQLHILYSIGAYVRLKQALDKYSFYADNKHYKLIKALLLASSNEITESDSILKSFLENKRFQKDKQYQVVLNNLYSTAMARNDNTEADWWFSKIENYVSTIQDKSTLIVEILIAMMYRYDKAADEAGMAKVRAMVSQRSPKTFKEFLDLGDIELFYNRRHSNIQDIRKYLDDVVLKADQMEPDEESRLIFNLKIIPLYIEFNYKWKEITNATFKEADDYIHYSEAVALAYVEMLTRVVSDAFIQHNMLLEEKQMLELMRKAYNQSYVYMNSVKAKINTLTDDFLYKKISLWRTLYLMERLHIYFEKKYDDYVRQLIVSHKKILELCKINGHQREYIHYLMIYIDEFLTIKEQIINMPITDDIKKTRRRLEAEEPNVKEIHNELKEYLNKYDYNRSVAYQTLWTAKMCAYYGEADEARLLLQKFEENDIDIRNYTAIVQNMYYQLRHHLFPSQS